MGSTLPSQVDRRGKVDPELPGNRPIHRHARALRERVADRDDLDGLPIPRSSGIPEAVFVRIVDYELPALLTQGGSAIRDSPQGDQPRAVGPPECTESEHG